MENVLIGLLGDLFVVDVSLHCCFDGGHWVGPSNIVRNSKIWGEIF